MTLLHGGRILGQVGHCGEMVALLPALPAGSLALLPAGVPGQRPFLFRVRDCGPPMLCNRQRGWRFLRRRARGRQYWPTDRLLCGRERGGKLLGRGAHSRQLRRRHGHHLLLEHLGLKPLLDLGMRLGEGTGAALGILLSETATRILAEMSTFAEAGVSGRNKSDN